MIRWKLGWVLDGSWIDFWWILGPTWLPKPSHNPSKINPRAVQNPTQHRCCHRSLFWLIFYQIFIDFHFLEGVLVPLGARMAPGPPTDPCQDWFLCILDTNLMAFGAQLCGFGNQLDRFWASTWRIIVKQWMTDSLGNQLPGCPTPGTVAGMARRATG